MVIMISFFKHCLFGESTDTNFQPNKISKKFRSLSLPPRLDNLLFSQEFDFKDSQGSFGSTDEYIRAQRRIQFERGYVSFCHILSPINKKINSLSP